MAKNTMTTCSSCGAEIAKSAKACPSCGAKVKKPFFKRPIGIILIIVAVIAVVGALGGGSDDSNTTASNDTSSKTEESTTANEESTQKKSPEDDMTTAQKNAYHQAQKYLSSMAFSRQGLIDQLLYEKYDESDAEFAVKTLEKEGLVDWNEQAVKKAKSYLETSSFSKDELIQQLESEYGEKFTHDQAVHGADAAYK